MITKNRKFLIKQLTQRRELIKISSKTHRVLNPNNHFITKSRIMDSSKKSMIKTKKSAIKTSNKKIKIKVNVPKDEALGANMMIKEALNFSAIDYNALTENLMAIDPHKNLSRSYLSTTKHQKDSSFTSSVRNYFYR